MTGSDPSDASWPHTSSSCPVNGVQSGCERCIGALGNFITRERRHVTSVPQTQDRMPSRTDEGRKKWRLDVRATRTCLTNSFSFLWAVNVPKSKRCAFSSSCRDLYSRIFSSTIAAAWSPRFSVMLDAFYFSIVASIVCCAAVRRGVTSFHSAASRGEKAKKREGGSGGRPLFFFLSARFKSQYPVVPTTIAWERIG